MTLNPTAFVSVADWIATSVPREFAAYGPLAPSGSLKPMRWKDREGSANIEDRRGMAPQGALAGGGLGMLVILVLALLFGANPLRVMRDVAPQLPAAGGGPAAAVSPEEEELKNFVAVVLKDTEDVWNPLFAQAGLNYEDPTLVMFTGMTRSGCGQASAASGPFYCPVDQKVYIDLAFYDELKRNVRRAGRLRPGLRHRSRGRPPRPEPARHHREGPALRSAGEPGRVQPLLRATRTAGRLPRRRLGPPRPEDASTSSSPATSRKPCDAATAIGDDAIQSQAQGYVVPDSFTHGTSDQRVRWFMKGLETGDMNQGDTFNVPYDQL